MPGPFYDDEYNGVPPAEEPVAPTPFQLPPTQGPQPVTAGPQAPGTPEPSIPRWDPAGAPVPPPGVSQSQSWSAKAQGMTDDGLIKTERLKGQTEQKTTAAMGPMRASTNRTADAQIQGTQAIQQSVLERAAEEREYHANVAALNDRVADFEDTFRQLDERARADARAEAKEYVATYKQQLAGVRNLMGQNANPLGGLDSTGGFALGMAQFAQGFLAARGVQIDVAGQVDRWVERELREHQQKISNSKALADETLTIAGLARQTAQDDAEARLRLRGFVIEGFKARIVAEGSRFQSDIAKASADAQVAKLDIELANNLNTLESAYHEQRLRTRTGIVDEAYKMGQLSIQRAELALKAQAAQREEKAAAAKAAQDANAGLLYDTTTGKPVAQVRPEWQGKQPHIDFLKSQAGAQELAAKMAEFRKLQDQYGSMGVADKTRLGSTMAKKLQALYGEVLMTRQRILTGAAATAQEQNLISYGNPEQVFASAFKASEVIAQTERGVREKLERERTVIADVLPENDPRRQLDAGKQAFDPAGMIDAKATEAGGQKLSPTVVTTAVDVLARPDATRPASSSPYEKLGVDPEAFKLKWSDYLTSQVGVDTRNVSAAPPAYAVAIEALAEQAKADPGGGAAKELAKLTNADDPTSAQYARQKWGDAAALVQGWARYATSSHGAEPYHQPGTLLRAGGSQPGQTPGRAGGVGQNYQDE